MVKGLRSLNRKLTRTIPDRVRQAVRAAMEKSANEIVAFMRALVPVDEGALRASIGWTWGDPPDGSVVFGRSERVGDGEAITIYAGDRTTIVTNSRGIEFQNALLQEFGTQNMSPSPFFFPAYRTLKRRTKGRITRAMKKAIREGAK